MPDPIITKRRVRCAATVDAPFGTMLQDFYNGQQIESVKGNATRFEFGFLNLAGEIYDLSNVQTLNLKIKTSQTVNTSLADQTLAAEDLDLTTTLETWKDGTQQHAVFVLSNAEMNLPVSATKAVLWLVVTAILADGSEFTLTGGNITLHQDNNDAADPAPENPGTALTIDQADARYPLLTQVAPPLQLYRVPRNHPVATAAIVGLEIDWKFGPIFKLTDVPGGSEFTFANPAPGKTIEVYLAMGVGPHYSPVWPAGITWEAGAPTTSDATPFLVTLTCTGAGTYAGSWTNTGIELPDNYTDGDIATVHGQTAFTTHDDGSTTEWTALVDAEDDIVVWLPRTGGVIRNQDNNSWECLVVSGATIQTSPITNQ